MHNYGGNDPAYEIIGRIFGLRFSRRNTFFRRLHHEDVVHPWAWISLSEGRKLFCQSSKWLDKSGCLRLVTFACSFESIPTVLFKNNCGSTSVEGLQV